MKKPSFSHIPNRVKEALALDKLWQTAEPGFIGRIPYILIIRWLIAGGILFRYYLHRTEYSAKDWIILGPCFVAIIVLAGIASVIVARRDLKGSKRLQGLFIFFDIPLISFFYLMTRRVESDFFLFYYLPIFIAAEHLSPRVTAATFVAISCTFLAVLVGLHSEVGSEYTTFGSLFWREFMPREVFFLSVAVLSSYLWQTERMSRERLCRRKNEMETLLKMKMRLDELFDEDEMIQLTVDKVLQMTKADCAYAWVDDPGNDRCKIRLCKVVNGTPIGQPSDASAEVVQEIKSSKQPLFLKGQRRDRTFDQILDGEICESLHLPIVLHENVLGGIAVGVKPGGVITHELESFLRSASGHLASALTRARLLLVFREIAGATTSVISMDVELGDILNKLEADFGFEYGIIYLVDEFRNVVEAVRGKNVPKGILTRSKYDLAHTNFVTSVVKTRETKVGHGWCDRPDRDVFERFGYDSLVHVFAPIVTADRVVGVIEAGCRADREDEVVTKRNKQNVEQLGRGKGLLIDEGRPWVLLEIIANRAMELVGGDSASIHVYESDQPLFTAGAGRASKEFILRFSHEEIGIGLGATSEGGSIIVGEPEDLSRRYRSFYAEGIRAFAAFSLSLGTEVRGVLCVHFWEKHRFSQAEYELQWLVARQIEIIIQNYLLLRGLAERAEAISGFQKVVHTLASSLDLSKIAEDIVTNVLSVLDADNVVLYEYLENEGRFRYPPTMKGTFSQPDMVGVYGKKETLLKRLVLQGKKLFLRNIDKEGITGVSTDEDGVGSFIEREGIISTAALVLQTTEPRERVGVMFVNFRIQQEFTPEEKILIDTLCSSAAVAIRSARLYEQVTVDLDRHKAHLVALDSIDRAIAESSPRLNVRQMVEMVLTKAVETIGANCGHVSWYNSLNDYLERGKAINTEEIEIPSSWSKGEGIVGLVAERMTSVLVIDSESEGIQLSRDMRSAVAAPLRDKKGLLGVLCLEHREPKNFTIEDKAVLETFATTAVLGVHSVELYRKAERQVQPMRALGFIATRIQSQMYDIETSLRLVLTGVTAGEGLAFSRAFLLLIDDSNKVLEGRLAVGSLSQNEANSIWTNLQKHRDEVRNAGHDTVKEILNAAEEFSISVIEGKANDLALSSVTKNISIPLSECEGGVAEALFKNRTTVVEYGQPDFFRSYLGGMSDNGDNQRGFACVPLVGKGKAIGVLVVDNQFLAFDKEIGEEDKRSLEAFSYVAATTIENSVLLARLSEEQRRRTWRNFTARVAHLIGGRVSVLEGETTRLRWSLDKLNKTCDGTESVRDCLGRLSSGIAKINRVLTEFRMFATPLELRPQQVNLSRLVEGLVEEIRHSIKSKIHLMPWPSPVMADVDPERFGEAVHELIKNADESFEEPEGEREISVCLNVEDSSLAGSPTVWIEIADNGPGIEEPQLSQLFEPYFTTKGRGSGLGLAIVKDVIEKHQGKIVLKEKAGQGACFAIRLPVSG